MIDAQALLRDLTAAVAAAWIGGAVATRLRLNPMLGYLAAGTLIGPFTPGYQADPSLIQGMATLGLIFLLFSLGLEFSVEELRHLGVRAMSGNVFAMCLSCAVAWCISRLLGFVHPITAAITTAVSSTAVGAALLRDWREEHTRVGTFTISQQVVQDVAAVILLVVTTVPLTDISFSRIAIPVMVAVLFVAVAIAIGHTVLQRIVRRTLLRASTERLFIAFTAISLISAWLGEYAGLSYEFGAFVAGAVISEAAGSKMIVSIIAPFRALFVALFFISIGMLLDVNVLRSHALWIVGFAIILFAVRAGIWTLIGKQWKLSTTGAVASAAAMAALGEFNVVLINEATNALRLDLLEKQILLGTTLMSIVLGFLCSPLVNRMLIRRKALIIAPEGNVEDSSARVAIIGYGRVGRTVASILHHAGIPFSALDHDIRAVRHGDQTQIKNVIYGDALDPMALDRVIGPSTRIVLTTAPYTSVNASVTRYVSERYKLRVVARAAIISDIDLLAKHGAHVSFVPEAEGALVFANAVLRELAYTPDEIEDWVHSERLRMD
jgi:CPA2 family monovalent cation:H+ antiporter-2